MISTQSGHWNEPQEVYNSFCELTAANRKLYEEDFEEAAKEFANKLLTNANSPFEFVSNKPGTVTISGVTLQHEVSEPSPAKLGIEDQTWTQFLQYGQTIKHYGTAKINGRIFTAKHRANTYCNNSFVHVRRGNSWSGIVQINTIITIDGTQILLIGKRFREICKVEALARDGAKLVKVFADHVAYYEELSGQNTTAVFRVDDAIEPLFAYHNKGKKRWIIASAASLIQRT